MSNDILPSSSSVSSSRQLDAFLTMQHTHPEEITVELYSATATGVVSPIVRKGGYKQRDVNASRFFSLLPHVEPITVLPHERDMNRSSVAARMERRVTCVDTSTFERAVDSRCITIYGIYSKRKNRGKICYII